MPARLAAWVLVGRRGLTGRAGMPVPLDHFARYPPFKRAKRAK